ncbi:MAG: hypothetical protein ACK6A5_16305 [Flavobacteriales bacterium]
MNLFRTPVLLLLLLLGVCSAPVVMAQDALPIGTWRAHFPYRNTIAVAEGGGFVYCATSTGVFRYAPASGE